MRYQLGPEYISDRAAAVGDSITLQISALAKQMKIEGNDVISFSQGEPDFDTPESIKIAGIEAIQQGKTKYTAVSGIPELKQAIIAKLKRDQGLDYGMDNILVSCGAKHSIFNANMALINPGDEVIIPAPYWVSYPDQVVLAGGVPVIVNTTSATDFKITPDQLQKAVTKKSKVLILCTPSNPTGMLYSKFELKALAEVILKNDLIVYSDEIYEKLIYGGKQHLSIAQISAELKKRTVIINGVSKAYSMTGWRIGYMAASSSIIQAASKIQAQSTSNPTTASQWASVHALNQSEEDMQKMTDAFDKRRMYMVSILTKATELRFYIPHGAFYIFANIRSYIGLSCRSGKVEDSASFCSYLLQEQKVAIVPGSCFGMENFIRLSYSTSMADIEEGIERISHWLKTLK
jgi:aspartate aminotransferase